MKKLLTMFLAFGLMVGAGSTAMAATSGLNNAPGGAGIAQWMAGPDGTQTLINIQNIAAQCAIDPAFIMIHITFYDRNSAHLFDVRWPMSPRDNVGVAVTGDGTNVNLTFEPGEVDETLHTFTSTGIGPDNLQFGYVTVAVTAVDDRAGSCYQTIVPALTMAVGNGNGNPADDPDNGNTDVVLPDILFVRSAILSPSGFLGGVLGLNGVMIQGFANVARLAEVAGGDFINVTGADAACAVNVDWDNDGSLVAPTNTPSFDNNGIDINSEELYMTRNYADLGNLGEVDMALQMASTAPPTPCSRAGRISAVGSQRIPVAPGPVPGASGATAQNYWARFNVTPGLTETSLVLVFPANSATAFNSAHLIADNRTFSITAFDDDEHPVSTPGLSGPEVVIAPFSSPTNVALPGMPTIQHSVYEHGEALLWTLARVPMFGYVYTTVAGAGADIYPLIVESTPVNVANIEGADLNNGGNNVDIISIP